MAEIIGRYDSADIEIKSLIHERKFAELFGATAIEFHEFVESRVVFSGGFLLIDNAPTGEAWYWYKVDRNESIAQGGVVFDQPQQLTPQVCEDPRSDDILNLPVWLLSRHLS